MSISLFAADGGRVNVDTSVARQSTLISNMLDDLAEAGSQEVPLPGIENSAILMIAMDYATGCCTKPDFDRRAFLRKLETSDLVDLVNVANYMEIRDLFQSACEEVAETLVGKSAEEMTSILRLQEDACLSPP